MSVYSPYTGTEWTAHLRRENDGWRIQLKTGPVGLPTLSADEAEQLAADLQMFAQVVRTRTQQDNNQEG